MTITTILFDLGGTLLHYYDPETDDRQRHFRRVTLAGVRNMYAQLRQMQPALQERADIAELVDQHIRQAAINDWSELRGGTVETPVRAALVEMGAEIDDAVWKAIRPLFYREIDQITSPRAGLKETLKRLDEQGYKLGIISNTMWAADIHDRHLDEQGVLNYFAVRVYSCDTERVKPHPSIFALALSQMGASADEAVYVGDRLDVDVNGAQEAGLRGILIRSPYMDQTLDDIRPDAIINELPDLEATLSDMKAGTNGQS